MDGWPPEPQRHHHKQRTSPPEMSQRSTLSPHPFSYRRRDPSDPSFVQYSAMDASLDNPGNSFGRRRTVHPHNPPMHRIHRSQEDTPERSRPNPPPRLEHRASQTLTIDLTDDNDELPQDEPPRPREQPRAGRNSGVNESNVIDLTDDNDVEITRVAPRPLPSLSDMALNVPRNQIPRMNRRLPFLPQEPARSINRVFPAHNPMPRGFHVTALGQGEIIFHPSPNFLDHIQMLEDATAIIGQMDRQIDLQRENGAAAHSRPDHIAPPDAKAGFTRSPTEKDVVICPSCEEELIQDKDPDEVAVKKSGKAPTRKEREEHPFWVVKSCGHVYCNRCYQNRLPTKQQPETVHFRDKASAARGAKGTIPMCSVDECPSEVKNKDKWVGVFL